jgi:hydrogenase nickel incorporation protein HypB
MKVVLQEDILKFNKDQAEKNRKLFNDMNLYVFNVISSPGSGKTTFLCNIIKRLSSEFRIAVVEGDLFTTKDAERIEEVCPVVSQINTSGACHLEADTIHEAIADFDLDNLDIIFVENVGNLVCPSEFDLGEDEFVTILSVTEGDDKPEKYPFSFSRAGSVIINKVDLLPYTNFRMDYAKEQIRQINPEANVFKISSLEMSGYDELIDYLKANVHAKIG